jgi:hypothetical protein
MPMKVLHQSLSMRNTEIMLLQIRTYFEWHLTVHHSYDVESWAGWSRFYPLNAYHFEEVLTFAIDLLGRGEPKLPWDLIDFGCSMARDFLRQQQRNLLRRLFLLFSDEEWAKFHDLRHNLVKYLANMAQQVLPVHHPLSTILKLLGKEDTLIDLAEPAIRLMLDVTIAQTGRSNREVGRIKIDLVDLLRKQGKFGAATDVTLNLTVDDLPFYGSSCNPVDRKGQTVWAAMEEHSFSSSGTYKDFSSALGEVRRLRINQLLRLTDSVFCSP